MPRRAVIAGFWIASGLVLAAEAPQPPPEEKAPTVEEARRALQQVPLNEKESGAPKAVSPTLPTTTMFRLGESPLPARDKDSNKQAWLLDEQASENAVLLPDGHPREGRLEGSARGDAAAPAASKVDPLAALLPQWFGKPDLRTERPANTGRSDVKSTVADPLSVSSAAWGAQNNSFGSLGVPVQRNPYLDPVPAASVVPVPSTMPPGAPLVAVPLLPGMKPANDAADPSSRTQAASPPQDRTPRPPVTPPTAPIVDDRKYFPQLRRF